MIDNSYLKQQEIELKSEWKIREKELSQEWHDACSERDLLKAELRMSRTPGATRRLERELGQAQKDVQDKRKELALRRLQFHKNLQQIDDEAEQNNEHEKWRKLNEEKRDKDLAPQLEVLDKELQEKVDKATQEYEQQKEKLIRNYEEQKGQSFCDYEDQKEKLYQEYGDREFREWQRKNSPIKSSPLESSSGSESPVGAGAEQG